MKNDDMTKTIGNRIRKARYKAGLSLSQLSDKTPGLSKSRISNYEQGIRRCPVEAALLLGPALGVSPEYLFGFTEQESA